MARKHLGEILVEEHLVSESDVEKALQVQKEQGGAIGEILVNLGVITHDHLLQALGKQ